MKKFLFHELSGSALIPDSRALDLIASVSSADPSRDLPSPRRDVVNAVSALMIEAINDIFSILL